MASPALLSAVSTTGDGQTLVQNKDGQIFPLLSTELSRIIYIRDNDTGEFWSLGWNPTQQEFEYFEAKHGLGYSQISMATANISSSLTVVQAGNEPAELWRISIGNSAERKRRLSLFVVARWASDVPALQQQTSFYKRVLLNSRINSGEETQLVRFMTSNQDLDDFDGLETSFVGPFGSFAKPKTVVGGKVSKSKGSGEMGIGCLQKNITLGNKATVEFTVIVGGLIVGEKESTDHEKLYQRIHQSIKPFLAPGSIETVLTRRKTEIHNILEKHRLASPEAEVNRYYNFFWPYQALVRADWPTNSVRSSQKSAEAVQATVALDAAKAEAILFDLFAHQTKDGRLANSWLGQTISQTADSNVSGALDLLGALVAYINETGDQELLRASVPYADGGTGSIAEHCIKAVEYALEAQDETGLVATGFGDSSTALGFRLITTLNNLLPILEATGHSHAAIKYRRIIANAPKQLDKMWSSPWYSRGKLGSSRLSVTASEHGFDLASQVWAVLSGAITSERAKQIIEKLAKQAVSNPPLNLWPAYKKFSLLAPELSNTAPGLGANSSVDINLVTHLISAAVATKQSDIAWRWLKQASAVYSASNPSFGGAPFWDAVSINGPDSALPGEATVVFANGAGELLTVFREKICGIQPTLDGLYIDPCIPKAWRSLEISRQFRGAEYQFRIQNPFRVASGVDRIIVDGIRITGNTIRPFSGGVHFVEITLG